MNRLRIHLALLAIAAFLMTLGYSAFGQTTQPARIPVAVWFQPARNVPMLASLGVTVFLGPEVENAGALKPDALAAGRAAWIKAVEAVGGKCILKEHTGPLPASCIGLMLTDAEANRNNKGPSDAMKAESLALRAAYPGTKIYVDLAGDKISSANFGRDNERQVYVEYGAVSDGAFVNSYPANRNAARYPMSWTADVVTKLAAVTGDEVWACIEMNDQVVLPLPKPADGFSRGPTPAEIKAQVDLSIAAGAKGIIWFATSQSNQYGWGVKDPAKGDSYWPLIDRTGASIAPQLATVKAIGLALNPPATTVDPAITALQQTVADLRQQLTATRANVEAARARIDAFEDRIRQAGAILAPATQPMK